MIVDKGKKSNQISFESIERLSIIAGTRPRQDQTLTFLSRFHKIMKIFIHEIFCVFPAARLAC